MNSNSQNLSTPEENVLVLTDADISTEQVGNVDRAVVSADQMEDISFQANGQNFQHN